MYKRDRNWNRNRESRQTDRLFTRAMHAEATTTQMQKSRTRRHADLFSFRSSLLRKHDVQIGEKNKKTGIYSNEQKAKNKGGK